MNKKIIMFGILGIALLISGCVTDKGITIPVGKNTSEKIQNITNDTTGVISNIKNLANNTEIKNLANNTVQNLTNNTEIKNLANNTEIKNLANRTT